jgi:AraC-like DNA-binding protein
VQEKEGWRMPARIQPATANSLVRVGPLMNIPVVLREFGCEPETIFSSVGFTLTQFEDLDTKIPYTTASKLLARCVAETGCPHFGLLVGARAVPSFLGIPGFMLRTAPDVATALHGLMRHLDLHDQGGVVTLVRKNDVSWFGYTIYETGAEAVDQIYDMSVAVACNIMRDLCGADWNPTEVHFSRQASHNPAPYRRFFQAPLRLEADKNALVFSTHWLDHRPTSADDLLHHYLEQEANKLHLHREGSIVSEVRRLLRMSLETGQCTVSHIAKRLCMHERTLNRRLQAEGTTFSHELENMRYEVARQLLSESKMPLARIATALQYADTTVFIRAFKQWAGISPGQWRVRNGREG